jgi:hypothetical protein
VPSRTIARSKPNALAQELLKGSERGTTAQKPENETEQIFHNLCGAS